MPETNNSSDERQMGNYPRLPLSMRPGVIASGALPLLLVSGIALANQNPDLPTKMEALQLPPYCHQQFGIPSQTPPIYKTCGHLMNHFCSGLVQISRASKSTASKSEKKHAVTRARKNIDYTKAGMPPNCAFASDVAAADSKLRVLEMFAK